MFQITKKSIEWGGRTLTLETGRMARQADAAVLVSYGDTVALCTVVAAKKPKPDIDFFPLTVVYQEKAFAAGKIPGGFFKREGKPSEREVLTSRLIDRPIRPLFADGFFNEVQIICTLLSYDGVNEGDVLSLIGASAALALSGLPCKAHIAATKVGYHNGVYLLNPSVAELMDSSLELMMAATHDSIMMIESEAKGLSEEVMRGALQFGHEQMMPVHQLIREFANEAGSAPWEFVPVRDEVMEAKIRTEFEPLLRKVYQESQKAVRRTMLEQIDVQLKEMLATEPDFNPLLAHRFLKSLKKHIVRRQIMETKKRIDGRDLSTVRPILGEVGVLPRTHGSALFTRGETQSLCVATLGTGHDEQIIDGLEKQEFREHFMLHYNFPPYSVGEASQMRPPGRREIGHGKLAWRALRSVLPEKAAFPYTIRVVSEITESNGSSSMATVCGTSLALMDAGVPIVAPVSGIAMGLILEADGFAVLSDILGDEDDLGDMDFKVAGTASGVTALQMDIKVPGITMEIMEHALRQAHTGRMHILGEMNKALSAPRVGLNRFAPTITTITIPKDKIREVIGSGGKVIREICEVSGATIDIDDDGTVRIAAVDGLAGERARDMVLGIVTEPDIGAIYEGVVSKIAEFGAFVTFMGGRVGLVHVSELAQHRVANVTDVVKEGDVLRVKLLGIDRGKFKLSVKAALQDAN